MKIKDKNINYKEYYTELIDKLQAKNMYEEIAFVKLGVYLTLRTGELLQIRWSQIEFPYIKDVYCPKYDKILYKKVILSQDVIEALKKLQLDAESSDALVFPKSLRHYMFRIRYLDNNFMATTIYKLGKVLK